MHENQTQWKCARVLFLDDLVGETEDPDVQVAQAAQWAAEALRGIGRIVLD